MNKADQRAALLRVVVERPGPAAPDVESWHTWVSLARTDRVSPLLFRLVDVVPTNLTDEERREVRDLQGAALARAVRLEHHLLAVTRVLHSRGIRTAVLKGGATAHLDYPDPSWRELGDVDVLIDPAHRPQAVAALEADGWVQGYPLPVGHEEFTHAITFVRDGVELDLHQHVAHRALGLRIPTSALLDRAITYEVAGVQLHALDDVDRLIHAAIHAVSSRDLYRRLSSTADVLLMASLRLDSASSVLARADAMRVRTIVERAVRDSHRAAQLEVPVEWCDAMAAPLGPRDRLIDRAYLGQDRRPIAEELAYLWLLRGWRRRWRYLSGYFTTSAEYAAHHERSGTREQLRYLLRKVRNAPPR